MAQPTQRAAALGDDREGRLALWQVIARAPDQGSRLSAVARIGSSRERRGPAFAEAMAAERRSFFMCGCPDLSGPVGYQNVS